MSEVDTWRLQHCGHRSANKDGHSLLLLRPGFIQAHVYASPETDGESGKLTVKVPWKIGGSQAVKKCSMMDLGQDSPVSCIHGHQSFCSRSIRTFQTSGELFCLEKLSKPHRGAERFQMSKHLIKDAPVDVCVGPSTTCVRVGTLISPEWFLPFQTNTFRVDNPPCEHRPSILVFAGIFGQAIEPVLVIHNDTPLSFVG